MRQSLRLAALLVGFLVCSLVAPGAGAAQQLDSRVIIFTSVGQVHGYTNATLDAEESAAARLAADADEDGNVTAAEVATFEERILRRLTEAPGDSSERLDGAPPKEVHFLGVHVTGLAGSVNDATPLSRSTHYALTFAPVEGDRHTFTRAVENETGAMWRLTAPPGYLIAHVGGFRQIFLTAPNEASAQAGTQNVTFTFAVAGASPPPVAPPAPSTSAVPFSMGVVLLETPAIPWGALASVCAGVAAALIVIRAKRRV